MKKTLFAFLFLLFSITIYSQFFIESGIGYAISTDKTRFYNVDIVSVDDKIDNVYNSEKTPIKFSTVQSPFVNIYGGYKLKKWEFSLGFSYCDNKTFKSLNRNNSFLRDKSTIWSYDGDDRILVSQSIANYSFYSKGYYLIPEVSYNFNVKQFSIKPILGMSLRHLLIYETVSKQSANYAMDTPEEESPNYVTQHYQYKYSFSNNFNNMFDLCYGLQISYNINNNFDLSCKIKYGFRRGSVAYEKVQTLYELEFDGSLEESDQNEYIYQSNRFFDSHTLDLSFGFRYVFSKSNKNKDNI